MPKEPDEDPKNWVLKNVQLFNEASYVISAIYPSTKAIINVIQEKATIENLYLRK
jgi:hypothetical protein